MAWTCRKLAVWGLVVMMAGALDSCAHFPGRITPMLGKDTWRSYDGKIMPWRHYDVPAGHPVRAVVIAVHGLSGASSDFWPLGEKWPPRGIAVYGIELRGQGNDPDLKKRGDIRSAKLWQKDLLTFHQLVSERYPGVPIFWYGESLGALISLHAADKARANYVKPPDAIVFASPAAGLRLQLSTGRMLLLRSASTVMPLKRVNLEQLAGVKDSDIHVTTTTTHEEQMAKTPHYVSTFTLRLLDEVYTMMIESPNALRDLRMPVLVLGSPNDVIASPEQIRKFYDEIGSKDKTLLWYRQSYHLLLHDVQRWKVLGDATQWVEARLPAAGSKKILR
jgi:alpha-beta hydrolase superfamily lysophospholipase